MRTCSPTASVTGRPLRWISSASCTPVAEPPTTSTPPSASCAGDRYVSGVTDSTDRGSAEANGGTAATLAAPVATTTLAHRHVPRSVATVYPSPPGATRVTLVPCSTGASIVRA